MSHLDFFKQHVSKLKVGSNHQAIGLCPLHEDHAPSFSCNIQDGLWKCHGCGESGNIFQLAKKLGVESPEENDKPIPLKEVARYTYEDEKGNPVLQVRRYFPKTFRQFRSDGNGGWIASLRGTPPVLYRLPDILKSSIVAVTEGEKDAETLHACGFAATTNPGGALKWKEEFSDTLQRKIVLLFRDMDSVGEDHVRRVSKSLWKKATTIKIISLPKGKDVTEWKELGGTLEELKKIIEETPILTSEDIFQNENTASKSEEDKSPTQASLLVELLAEATLFHSPEGDAFVTLSENGHKETWSIRSKAFREWLELKFYRINDKPPSVQSLQDALSILEAQARYDGSSEPVFLRVAGLEDRVYLDLCNPAWEVVEITTQGWKVVSDAPVRFRRAKGMRALPHPVSGGSVTELYPLINIPNPEGQCAAVSWLVGLFRSTGPYPILCLSGPQGSAKSTTARLLRAIVDPSTAPLRSIPREERDLMITAKNSWILSYDNLSGISPWLADSLCRLSTGGGFATRELYSDSEEVLFEASRPMILNGIEDLTNRQDLADRALVVNLPALSDQNRCPEASLWKEFEKFHPRILGALCDAVSTALSRQKNIKLERTPRMADFAVWVAAAEPALPWPQGAFLQNYLNNQKEIIQTSLEEDPVTFSICALLDTNKEWRGTATELLEVLTTHVSDPIKRSRSWPQSARALSGRLKRAMTFLSSTGIEIEFVREAGSGSRHIIISRKRGENHTTRDANGKDGFTSSHGQPVPDDGCDDRDGCDETISKYSCDHTDYHKEALEIFPEAKVLKVME